MTKQDIKNKYIRASVQLFDARSQRDRLIVLGRLYALGELLGYSEATVIDQLRQSAQTLIDERECVKLAKVVDGLVRGAPDDTLLC